MVIIISKNYVKNALASGIFSVLSTRYHGCADLRSSSCGFLSVSGWGWIFPLTGEPDNRSQCRNLFCHPRVTLCSVLSGSAMPFPGSEGKCVKISALGGIPSGTMSSQPQRLVLWLRLFSWHLIITLLVMTLPLRSGTTGWCSLVVGILRHSKTAGKNLSGKQEKKQEQNKKKKAASKTESVFGFFFFGSLFIFNLLTWSVLCMSESDLVAKVLLPFQKARHARCRPCLGKMEAW